MDLNGKNLLYIGGFGGIGQKCLLEFLSKGIKNLAICDLSENAEFLNGLQTTYSDANIFYLKLDITKKDEIEAVYKEAATRMDYIDVVVNGCGLMNDRYIELSIQINLMGVINSTLTAINYMDKSKKGRGGVIVNISSVAGIQPSGMLPIYTATKFGVTAFTRSLAYPIYYESTGISYVTICPGLTDTGLLEDPENRIAFDVAAPVALLFKTVQRQKAEECARNLVKAVELSKNGSVWLLDLGNIKEVEFPVFWTPTF